MSSRRRSFAATTSGRSVSTYRTAPLRVRSSPRSEDLRRAGLEDQLRDALVAGLEHRRVEGELLARQPVLPQDLIESSVGADSLRDLLRERDVRELAIVGGDLGCDADEGGISGHGARIAET